MSMYELLYRKHFHSYVNFAFRECYPDEYFYDNWHIELIADLIQFISEYQGDESLKKVIFNLPSGHFKTDLCVVFFITWQLGRDPRLSVLIISETPGLAYELKERCVELMSKPRYKSLFSRARIKSNGKKAELTYGGCIQYSGIHSSVMRKKSDIVIIDNPQSLQSLDRLDPHTLLELPRLLKNHKKGLIMMNTRRLGEKDMTYHLEQISGWMNYRFPAVAPHDRNVSFPPHFEHQLIKGEPIQPEIIDWPEVESSLVELGWQHFLYQQMQGYCELNTHDRTYHKPGEKDGVKWIQIGKINEEQIAHRDFKILRDNYVSKKR